MVETVIVPLIMIVTVLAAVLVTVMYIVLLERKVQAWVQVRLGPMRVGPHGILQPLADVVKLVMKEDIVPTKANRFIHDLAPVISISIAMTTFSVIPFGDTITLFGQAIKLQIAATLTMSSTEQPRLRSQ